MLCLRDQHSLWEELSPDSPLAPCPLAHVTGADAWFKCLQDLSLSLAFDYADHDMYEIIRFHRDLGQPVPIYTIKSLMYQLLQGGGLETQCLLDVCLHEQVIGVHLHHLGIPVWHAASSGRGGGAGGAVHGA